MLHVRGITRSASTRRREGDGFDALLKTLKLHPLLLCQMCDIKSKNRGNALAPNRRTSLPCTVRTLGQSSCNQRVCCLLSSGIRIYEGDGS